MVVLYVGLVMLFMTIHAGFRACVTLIPLVSPGIHGQEKGKHDCSEDEEFPLHYCDSLFFVTNKDRDKSTLSFTYNGV